MWVKKLKWFGLINYFIIYCYIISLSLSISTIYTVQLFKMWSCNLINIFRNLNFRNNVPLFIFNCT